MDVPEHPSQSRRMAPKTSPGKCAPLTTPDGKKKAKATTPKAPAAPLRKSTRVPNLAQPMSDLSDFRTSKTTKKLLKDLADHEVAAMFLPPSVVEGEAASALEALEAAKGAAQAKMQDELVRLKEADEPRVRIRIGRGYERHVL